MKSPRAGQAVDSSPKVTKVRKEALRTLDVRPFEDIFQEDTFPLHPFGKPKPNLYLHKSKYPGAKTGYLEWRYSEPPNQPTAPRFNSTRFQHTFDPEIRNKIAYFIRTEDGLRSLIKDSSNNRTLAAHFTPTTFQHLFPPGTPKRKWFHKSNEDSRRNRPVKSNFNPQVSNLTSLMYTSQVMLYIKLWK